MSAHAQVVFTWMDHVSMPAHQVLPELERIAKDANHHALSALAPQITALIVWILSLSIKKPENVNKTPLAITANKKWTMENANGSVPQNFILATECACTENVLMDSRTMALEVASVHQSQTLDAKSQLSNRTTYVSKYAQKVPTPTSTAEHASHAR